MIDWRSGIGWLTNREHRWRRLGLLALGLAGASLILLLAWVSTCGFHGCPTAAQIQAFRPSEGSRILDRAGTPVGRLTYVRRINVPLKDVPRSVRAAFIATEDRRFYYHAGVDWRSAARALFRNLSEVSVREGFSTITMQVVRNAFLPHLSRERSLRRKLIELELARRLEHTLTKQQILETYLNVIYLGNGTYGVEAASRDLFGKNVGSLTVAEAATLAALAKGPALYAPRRHPERARARRDLVLSLMVREGYLSPAAAERAKSQPLRLARAEWRPLQDRSYALDPVRAVVDSALGEDGATAGDLVVYSTLDAKAQQAAERAVRLQAAAIQRQAPPAGKLDEVEGAMVALDPRTGEIRALVGGRRSVRRGFNRALEAHRQPGSAFKPFVYAAALSAGFTPATILDDSPVEIQDAGRTWRPENFGGEYGGPLTLRRALMRSANAATVRLSQAVGESRVAALAHRSGRGQIAGKTGTTNNGADVWFIGYTPTLVAGFWFGYDSPRTIASNASGGRLAAPAWATFYLDGWRERTPAGAWNPPADLVERKIDASNGRLSNEWCPVTQREWFKAGSEPTEICDEHDAPFIQQLEEFGRKIGRALEEILGEL